MDKDKKSFTFGCSYGFNQGIHTISIQNKGSTYYKDAFGITSNIDHFRTVHAWYGHSGCRNINAYLYVLNGDSLVVTNDRVNRNPPYRNLAKARDRDSNYKLPICINAEQWIVIFYLNGVQLGKPWNIVPNETY